MIRYQYPFNIAFSKKTSIFIDACFLLCLLDQKDIRFQDCQNLAKQLLACQSQMYVSPIVIAEVTNRLIDKLFIQDIRSEIDNIIPINSHNNINSILKFFSEKDKKMLSSKNINFKKYFTRIFKSDDRQLLDVYFKKAVEIEKTLEERLRLKYLSISRSTVQNAQKYIVNDMVGVNDAYHFAITVQKKIDYLLTLDGDFERIVYDKDKPCILKI